MDIKKPRSSLRRVTSTEDDEPARQSLLKRRISFSGKKFVREFNNTEEPKQYDYSYELSDHTNGEDSTGQGKALDPTLSTTATTAVTSMSIQKQKSLMVSHEKENIPVGDFFLDRTQADLPNLELQGSINVTLLPKERMLNDTSSSQNLYLSNFDLEKAKQWDSDKTLNLFSQSIMGSQETSKRSEINRLTIHQSEHIEITQQKETHSKTVYHEQTMDITLDTMEAPRTHKGENTQLDCFMDVTPLQPKAELHKARSNYANSAQLKTRIFENADLDISLDDQENREASPKKVAGNSPILYAATNSWDDSMLSSPLIPPDVIEANPISKNLNFRELNEAIDAGLIQVLPNTPRTPIIDRHSKKQRFCVDLSTKNFIKPRGPLDFFKTKDEMIKPNQPTKSSNAKMNLRLSQADETQLNNTYFLVHAKVGDETESCENSLADLASNRTSQGANNFKPRSTLLMSEAMEEEPLSPDPVREPIKRRPTLHIPEAMDETLKSPKQVEPEQPKLKHPSESLDPVPMEESPVSSRKTSTDKREPPKPRTTLYLSEPIASEDLSFEKVSKNKQPPLSLIPSMEENMLSINNTKSTATTKPISKPHKSPTVPEEESSPTYSGSLKFLQKKNWSPGEDMDIPDKPRATLNIPKSMDESLPKKGEDLSKMPTDSGFQLHKPRQTLHYAEPVDETLIDRSPPERQSNANVRHTMHLSESLEEEVCLKQVEENIPNRRKLRLTLHSEEPMDETLNHIQKLSNLIKLIDNNISGIEKFQETLTDIKETQVLNSNPPSQNVSRPRQTVYHPEPMDETLASIKELQPRRSDPPSQKEARPRQTVYRCEPMDETLNSINTVPAPKSNLAVKPRQTVYHCEPMDETLAGIKELQPQTLVPSCHQKEKISRQTVYHVEPMDETLNSMEELKSQKPNLPSRQERKPRQTVCHAEPMDETLNSNNKIQPQRSDPPSLPETKPRQTVYNCEHMDETLTSIKKLQTQNTDPSYHQQVKIRQTVYHTESIDESLTHPPSLPETKPRQTVYQSEPMDESLMSINKLQPQNSLPPCQQQVKSRQTVYQAEPMDETLGQSPNEDVSAIPQRLKHLRMLMTPVAKFKQQAGFSNFSPATPGRSMLEFEDLEEECKSSEPEKPPEPRITVHRDVKKRLSIYEAVDMELDMEMDSLSASPEQSKRSHAHLTPNMPLSKKRNLNQSQLDNSERTLQQVTPSKANCSRIPVLTKRIPPNSPQSTSKHRTLKFEEEQLERNQQLKNQTIVHIEDSVVVADDEPVQEDGQFEDNPVTVSDISMVVQQVRCLPPRPLSLANQLELEDTPPSSNRASSETNPIDFKSIASANRHCVNLSGESTFFQGLGTDESNDLLETVRLSLVSSMINDVDDLAELSSYKEEESRSSESFELPARGRLPDLSLTLERFRKACQKPTITDVIEYWQFHDLERRSTVSGTEYADLDQTTNTAEEARMASVYELMQEYKNSIVRYERSLAQKIQPKPIEPYCDRLELLLRDQAPNWIFDYQLQSRKQFIFSHRKIVTFQLTALFKPRDVLYKNVEITCLDINSTRLTLDEWCAVDHLLDFQMKLKLPLNLMDWLEDNNELGMAKFLRRLDEHCLEIVKAYKELDSILIDTRSRLIRQPNRTIVCKTVREKVMVGSFVQIRKRNFVVEIGNLNDVCFGDIVQPDLYLFNENIQYLPKGIEFLREFLKNPLEKLKPLDSPMQP